MPKVGPQALHIGDKVARDVCVADSDAEQQAVLRELWRIGWIEAQRALLVELVDVVWAKATELGTTAAAATAAAASS
eukprot:COSAG01_NODE_11255_length_1971_cov_3.190171_2_plen_77_part_00